MRFMAEAPLALYRKYRPATFAQVKGQEHVTGPLRQALRSGRINHAYLFSGPRGCGKTSSARILARSLNCVNGPTPDPCGECESCIALAPAGPGSIDVMEIDAASHGGVDDARELRERAFYTPVSGRFKIYIIDEAHMVTQQGFNALLKLVEEPPAHLKFIFATTEPEKVIPTIRSRTHHYPFRLVPPSILRELLEEILNEEGVTFDPAVLPLVVRAGAGSVRDSLSVLDQLVAGSDETGLEYERAIALLGYTDASLLDEITDGFAAADGAAVFHVVNRVVEGGHEPRRFATDMLDRFRDLIVLASVPDAAQTGLLDEPADRLDGMSTQAGRFGLAELTRAAEIVSAGLDQMRGTTSPRLLLELMCAQILLPAAGNDEKALLTRLERLERNAASGGAVSQPASGGAAHQSASGGAVSQPASGGAAHQSQPAGSGAVPAARASATTSQSPSAPGAPAATPADPAGTGSTTQSTGSQPGGSRPGGSQSGGPQSGGPQSGGPQSGGPQSGASAPEGAAASPSVPSVPSVTSAASSPSSAPASPAPGVAATGGVMDADSLRGRWEAVLDAVKRERRVAWMLLSNASVLSLEGRVLTLRFVRDGDVKGFTTSGCDADLKKVLAASFGLDVTVKAVSGNAAAQAASGSSVGAFGSGGGSGSGSSGGGAFGGGTSGGGSAGGPVAGGGGGGGGGGRASGTSGAGGGGAAGGGGNAGGANGGGNAGNAGGAGGAGSASGASGGASRQAGSLSAGGGSGQDRQGFRPGIADEIEIPDESDMAAPGEAELSGMDLIQRELGAQIIGEFDESS
jgi:DNA polymerase-3 subunit gamma/tau